MRLDIKTNGKVKDKDIKALYILNAGMQQGTERMRKANLEYIADRYGFYLIPKKV